MSKENAPKDTPNSNVKDSYRKQVPLKDWPSRSADLYSKIDQVGEGTFGKVYKAEYRDPSNKTGKPEIVALKKILMDNEKEGFPITAIREIMILKRLNHKNILRLIEIVTSKPKEKNKFRGNVYLVFEYMEHDISGLSDMKMSFTISAIKCIMYQILCGIDYLHKNNIIHRDIKSANILLNNKGEIKIGDFGLARIITSNNKKYTNRVVTLWYRAPELLLGETAYGASIDMWSIGCVFSELLVGSPPFKGKKEPEQVERIFEKCGSPTEATWPGVTSLPLFNQLNPKSTYPNVLRSFYTDNPKVDDCCFDLLSKMLILDPKKRISVEDAMKHPYFTTHLPKMCKPEELPKIEKDSHEYQSRKELKAKNNSMGLQIMNNMANKGMMIGRNNYQNQNVNQQNVSSNQNNNVNQSINNSRNNIVERYENAKRHINNVSSGTLNLSVGTSNQTISVLESLLPKRSNSDRINQNYNNATNISGGISGSHKHELLGAKRKPDNPNYYYDSSQQGHYSRNLGKK